MQRTRVAGPAGAEADGAAEAAAELDGLAVAPGVELGLCEAEGVDPEPQAASTTTAATNVRRARTA
jgi:hypothetical protein